LLRLVMSLLVVLTDVATDALPQSGWIRG
jgi:hypothetical protein